MPCLRAERRIRPLVSSNATLAAAAPATMPGFAERVDFVVALAARLHAYGTTAQRLEAAVVLVSQRLGMECQPWANPTGMILSFNDPSLAPGEAETTRVVRVPPGENDLFRLSEADRIADEVMSGQLSLRQGRAALAALDFPASTRRKFMLTLAFGLASASVAGLLRLPWLDIATAGCVGLLIGLLDLYKTGRPRLVEANEAVAGMVAGTLVVLVATFVGPVNLNTTIIASLIVLLPGLALSNAMNELTSQHLVAGTARFAGALTTVMKLTIGTAIALGLANLLGIEPQVHALRPQPMWLEWAALLVGSFAFAVTFQAQRRDYLLVMAAVISGYLISRWGTVWWGSGAGVFLGALTITAAGNAYARWGHRPGAIIRVPGIILLVPGSTSLRGLMNVIQQQDAMLGTEAVMAVINILLALLAGVLFGNLLLPTRRTL